MVGLWWGSLLGLFVDKARLPVLSFMAGEYWGEGGDAGTKNKLL